MPTCHKPQRPAVVVRRCSLNPRTPETTDSLNANSGNNLGTLQAVIAVSLAVFTALLAAPEVRAQTPNLTPPVTTPQPSAKNLHDWRKGMSRVPLPRRGASPPHIEHRVEGSPLHHPPRHVRTHRRAIGGRTSWKRQRWVGRGTGHISEAVRPFDRVTGVSSPHRHATAPRIRRGGSASDSGG